MLRLRSLVLGLVVSLCAGAALMATPAPAHADAQNGTCAKGWRLGDYSSTFKARNWNAEVMWTITYRKRWCYNLTTKAVGSVYAPKPRVELKSYFGNAWRYKGISDSDAYYSSKDWTGQTSTRYPRRSHVSWFRVKMDHCSLKWVACTSHTYKVGITAYWDGSKNRTQPQ